MTTWREGRARGQRIPKELWDAATELARVYGLNVTARALKLDYYDLQRRVRGTQGQEKSSPMQAAFVELPPSPGRGEFCQPGTVEVLQPSGARLKIGFSNPTAKELLPLVQAFLRS